MPNPSLQIDPCVFVERRKKIIAQMAPNSALVLAAGAEKARSQDTHYPFRCDSDFFYLSGFKEPEAWLVLHKGEDTDRVLMFCREKDEKKERWDGRRLGVADAPAVLNLDEAFSIESLDKDMPDLLENTETLYFPLIRYDWLSVRIKGWVAQVKARTRKGVKAPLHWIDSDQLIHEMRLIKSAEEIRIMRRVCEISAQAHVQAMQRCEPGIFEYQLEACYQQAFIESGCMGYAYESIVGGGDNACILHYVDNSAPLVDGDLVLVDAGGEFDLYAGDITRTFPVNGRFSTEQARLYQIVLDAQLAAIAEVKPGNPFDAPHRAAVASLTSALIDLGWIPGPLNEAITKEAYEPFFMHKTGHWLGLDVHDVGQYKQQGQWRLLAPGMVLTVEPGLYVDKDQQLAPEAWRGIGIRIEDDVLVTEEGCEILTASVPKEIHAIETLMAKAAKAAP